ncbi:MAG TPA: DUF2141 domain-containing protein [Thermoanaerobaculia bacterium]|jgi:uncharacterized protein (DUF2141 family)|nr:DUF2141 domain-containing protein [Thermoanaerobaculia bacterium]
MRTYLLAVVGLALTCQAAGATGNPPAADLAVNATGLGSAEGEVRVALYDSKAGFEGKQPPFRTATAKGAEARAQVVFRGLPPGDYAIALYHDRNGNGKLDRSFLGKPLEPYGFSNNARGTRGAPDFEKVRFTLPAAGASLEIRVR